MNNKIEKKRRGKIAGCTIIPSTEQIDDKLKEQRIIISEMKQTQIRAEIAYTSLYKKYTQAVYEKNVMQAEVQKAREEFAALVNSRSFRITKPLRALMRVIRRWIK